MSVAVNFIPPRRRQLRHVHARVRAWTLGVGLLVAALGGAQCILLAQGSVPHAGLSAELARVRAGLEKETLERAGIDRRIAEAQGRLALVRAIGTHPDWSVLLKVLARERGDRVVLERVSLKTADRNDKAVESAPGSAAAGAPMRADSYTLKLAGQALTQGDATRYTRGLEDLGVFDTVRLIEAKLVNVQGRDFVSFQIECAIAARRVSTAGVAAGAQEGAP